jgi:hypothetical protein
MLILIVLHICLAAHGRTPRFSAQINVVLGNLICMYYIGEVTQSDGTTSPATCWDDYALAPDVTYVTAKGAVWSDFWVSFSIILFQSFIPNTPDFATA